MLNLNHVSSLLMVVDAGGFRAAARQLGLSASTVVEHVDQLEAELAAPILVRERGRLALTEQGKMFEPMARALIDMETRCHALLSSWPLRIAAATNVGVYLLQPALASFSAIHDVPIEPWIGANPQVAARLEAGQADLAIMEWWDDRPGFAPHPWRREPMVLIASPGHEWARRGVIDTDELIGERILGGEGATGTGSALRRAFGPLAERLNVCSGFGSTEGVKRAVRAGLGVSIVMAAAVREEVANGVLALVEIRGAQPEKEIMIVARSGYAARPPLRRLVEYLLGES